MVVVRPSLASQPTAGQDSVGDDWLRVLERIDFHLAILTCRWLHDSAPTYLSADLVGTADVGRGADYDRRRL